MTLCSQAGLAPKVVQHARELGSVLGLVAAGIGIAILPSMLCAVGISDVVSRPLRDPGAVSELLLTVKANPVAPGISALRRYCAG